MGGPAVCNAESSKHVYSKVTEPVYRTCKGFQNVRHASNERLCFAISYGLLTVLNLLINSVLAKTLGHRRNQQIIRENYIMKSFTICIYHVSIFMVI